MAIDGDETSPEHILNYSTMLSLARRSALMATSSREGGLVTHGGCVGRSQTGCSSGSGIGVESSAKSVFSGT